MKIKGEFLEFLVPSEFLDGKIREIAKPVYI